MRRITIGRRGTVVAAVTAGTLALVGGVAYATIPAVNGTINGCYRNSEDDQKGQLRVVSDPTACRPNEVPIAWSQVGPQGAEGEPGAPGTNGANGTDGKDGVSITTAPEPAGASCAGGGVRIAAVSGVNYVCNGKDGADGEDGTSGLAGQSCPAGSQVVGFDASGVILCNDGGAPPPPPPPAPECGDNPGNVVYDGVCFHVWQVYELAVGNAPPFGRGVLLEDLLITSVGPSTVTASLSPPPNPQAPNDVEIELGELSAPALGSRVTVLGTVLAMNAPDNLPPGVAARLQGRRFDLVSGP